MTIGFHDVRLPVYIEQNATGGPQFSTTIVGVASGVEVRNQDWVNSKQTYDITYGVTEANANDGETFAIVDAFFRARRGRLYGFRFKDWLDYQAIGEGLGTGDGATATYQLRRTYADALLPYVRRITRPVVGTITVYVGGNALPGNGWTLGDLGLVTLNAAPGAGLAVTADFEFDVPVRFDADQLDFTAMRESVASVNAINLVEVRE